MEISQDFKEWLECLNATRTDYLVVGGYALAHHGCPRFTGDIDVLVRPAADNAARVLEALRLFGFGSLPITVQDLADLEALEGRAGRNPQSPPER